MSADQSQHDSKRRKGGSSKKGKKQKRQDKKAARTNINDWSSDDSDEAAPAPMPDQLQSMSDSDNDNNQEAAVADAAAAKASKARAESAKGKKDGKLQKAGDRKRKGGSNKGKERKSTGKERAAPAQVTDWTSDDSSDAEPAPLPDQLDSMSDSDPETQAAGRGCKAVGLDAGTARQAGKQHGSSHRSQSPDELPAALGQGNDGIDASPARDISDSGHQQQAKRAKRKGRLRKARASPGQAQLAKISNPEADDIMVELEDDVPGLDAAPEAGSNDVGQRAIAAGTNSRPEQAERMGSKRKSDGGESSKDRLACQ